LFTKKKMTNIVYVYKNRKLKYEKNQISLSRRSSAPVRRTRDFFLDIIETAGCMHGSVVSLRFNRRYSISFVLSEVTSESDSLRFGL
jgi:hypothetical protein